MEDMKRFFLWMYRNALLVFITMPNMIIAITPFWTHPIAPAHKYTYGSYY